MAECTQNPEFLLLPFLLMPTQNLLLGDGRVSSGVPNWWDAVVGSLDDGMQWWGSVDGGMQWWGPKLMGCRCSHDRFISGTCERDLFL